jgi:hypothetical protein
LGLFLSRLAFASLIALRSSLLSLSRQAPLSPDAFSPFSRYDPEKKTNETEVVDATHVLLNATIPNFACMVEHRL